MVSTWANFDGHIYHWYPLKYFPFTMYFRRTLLLFTRKTFFTNILTGIGSSDPTYLQNFRLVPLTVLRFKLKKNDNHDKKNWRNGFFAMSPMLMIQFKPLFWLVVLTQNLLL